MLSNDQIKEVRDLACASLEYAEKAWDEVKDQLVLSEDFSTFGRKIAASIDTQIPNYPTIERNKPMVDNFITIVVDMRNSTEHLLCNISRAKVSTLKRVFYETSVLLPCLAQAISYKDGKVTEYLGDGVLGLFCVDKNKERDAAIYNAYSAAENCLEVVRTVINPLIGKKYLLPPLSIGIGLAYSKAVVTVVGLESFMQPKVFGDCVFRATKLSTGKNLIIVDEVLEAMWPKSKDGKLSFNEYTESTNNIKGYIINKNN